MAHLGEPEKIITAPKELPSLPQQLPAMPTEPIKIPDLVPSR